MLQLGFGFVFPRSLSRVGKPFLASANQKQDSNGKGCSVLCCACRGLLCVVGGFSVILCIRNILAVRGRVLHLRPHVRCVRCVLDMCSCVVMSGEMAGDILPLEHASSVFGQPSAAVGRVSLRVCMIYTIRVKLG